MIERLNQVRNSAKIPLKSTAHLQDIRNLLQLLLHFLLPVQSLSSSETGVHFQPLCRVHKCLKYKIIIADDVQ
jgi:hypothetical protein